MATAATAHSRVSMSSLPPRPGKKAGTGNGRTCTITRSHSRTRLPDSYLSYNTDPCPPEEGPRPASVAEPWEGTKSKSEPPGELGYGFGYGSRSGGPGPGWLRVKSLSEGNLDRGTLGSESDFVSWNRPKDSGRGGQRRVISPGRVDCRPPEEHPTTSVMTRGNKTRPSFFRSISLRNLLGIGGMNKSRQTPATVKKVAPPVAPPSAVPGLVSFSSFRVKKAQSSRDSSSTTLSGESSTAAEKESQRYSGSSLGSAGSSYTSSGSSSSDNRSSIGTDDGFILPSPNGYNLKDLEDGICRLPPANSGNGLKNSASSDSFTPHHYPHHQQSPYPTKTTTVEMHQGVYGKTGGNSNGPGTANGSGPPHVTVQVDPHHYPTPASGGPSKPNVFSAGSSHTPNPSHYQTQISMEDQGIDMTQSPGRESPSSTASSNTGSGSGSGVGSVGSGSNGCRHSTSSFDSGRASSTIYQGVRYSGLSSESSSGSFRHSYHSSNSSLGSIPPEDICNFDVTSMIAQGVPDHEVLNAWLTGIHFECYYQNFIQAGYDMHTISRMTPEDLNAIGVTKPHHRKRLKSEISQLTISDGLPDYIPGSIEEWLGVLKLEEYHAKLRAQGYHSVRQVTNITWEDLEDIGILKLGHQKKFMLAIKRVEDILAGKRLPQPNNPNSYLTPMPDPFPQRPGVGSQNGPASSQGMPYAHHNQPGLSNGAGGGGYPYARGPPQHQIFRQHPNQIQAQNPPAPIYGQTLTHQPQLHHQQAAQGTPQYHPEVISIHVKNGGRRNSVENISAQEPIYGTSSFLPAPPTSNPTPAWQRCSGKGSFEVQDGDITPTNEMQGQSMPLMNPSHTSTLPRLLKNKPISKIMGGGGGDRHSIAPASCSSAASDEASQAPYLNGTGGPGGDGYKSLPRDIGRLSKAGIAVYNANGGIHGTTNGGPGYAGTIAKVPLMSKNGPPPPPRRGSCSSGEGIYGQLSSFQSQGGNYSGWTTQFPPPPPTLSCDVPYGSNRSVDDLPLPPHPEDLVLAGSQSTYQYQAPVSGPLSSSNTSTASSSSSSPNNPVKSMSTGSGQHYHPHGSSSTMRASPPNTKSRDPSPVGSDFSDSDLPNNGLMSRGVRRNGSDASFKSNSSTESESIPFANDNAGTIKQQKATSRATAQFVANAAAASSSSSSGTDGTGDVLNDIGNMLADLTDELDAILEQEIKSKR